MKVVVDYGTFGVDYYRPGGSAGTIILHDGRDIMGLRIAGGMGHGDFQLPFQLVFTQFFPGIKLIAFKNRLDGYKFNPVLFFISLSQFLKGWEPRPAASGSPVLKKIQVNHLAPVIFKPYWIHRFSITIDPAIQFQLRGLQAEDAILIARRGLLQVIYPEKRQDAGNDQHNAYQSGVPYLTAPAGSGVFISIHIKNR